MMDIPEIVQLGARKYYESRGVYQNPYALGTSEYNEFERGWMQSLKQDDGCLASEGIRQIERQEESAKERAATDQEKVATLYRMRKG